MARNKTISLDEHTAAIADRLPNFSRFVRQCLIKHAAEASEKDTVGFAVSHIAPVEARVWGEDRDKCNPMHRDGTCAACWGME